MRSVRSCWSRAASRAIPDSDSANSLKPSLPQLTDLSLNASYQPLQGISDVLHHIVACRQLRYLSLQGFSAHEHVAPLLSPSDFARRLESLVLVECDFEGLGDADTCAAVLAGCTQLTALILGTCLHVTPMLIGAARSCPRLKSVGAFPAKRWWRLLLERGINQDTEGLIPSPSEIKQLLEARRVAMSASSEFVPLTFALYSPGDSDVHADDIWVDVSRGSGDWITIRNSFVALVTPADDTAMVRFELVQHWAGKAAASSRADFSNRE